ncbi:MAG: lipopolysaccharide ABC transporter ATP-binding protein [Gammaproteobacteria bacterium]|nr:MAG: lipopolysaccharide ABC transporter ATP-binding protein [Gammaproteobacteria bacterium]RLA61443.1 MAG: lipopolysaccharide ABC transporter ATP-binding protein [Gammaproteobacteria bacterium]
MAQLIANNLAKAYGGREVVQDVSLQIDSGQVVGLLGPNGAGKTTCFYMIIGIVRADRGTITINGEDITARTMHERARRGIGYLPQEASIFRKLTVGDNILAILETRSDLDKKQRRARRDKLLEELHVKHLRDSLGQSLSGGERRRVEIARALATEPDFILLDEPFAGVDPISVSDIKQIINHLRDRDIGVLITDHNVRDTLDICEKAYIVGEGRIIAAGTAEDVLTNEHVRQVYLGDQFRM